MKENNFKIKLTLVYRIFFLFCFFSISSSTSAATLIKPTNNLGLVAYWSFEDATSTKATDFSGNGNTGTLNTFADPPTATSGWGNGKLGKGLNFDGSSDYVDAGTGLVFTKTSPMTISAWVKTSDTDGTVIANWNVGTNPGWEFVFVGGNIYFGNTSADGSNGYIKRTTNTYGNGTWQHIVGTYDGVNANGITIYVDGVSVSLTAVLNSDPGTLINDATLIGKRHNGVGDLFLLGSLDEVRAYSRVLGATEITGLYQKGATKLQSTNQSKNFLNNGLVGYWSMNGADTVWSSETAGTAYDRSGQGNHGTLTSMSRSVSQVQGKIGQALNFDGSNDYISIPDNLGLTGSSYSVSTWIKSTGSGGTGYRTFLNKGSIGNQHTYLLLEPSGYLYRWDAFNSGYALSNNIWYHVVYRFAATSDTEGTETFYVNGALVATRTGTIPASSGSTYKIGCSDSSHCYQGYLDEFRIYNRVLSQAEISQLYNQSQSKFQTTSQSANFMNSGLVGHWTFNGDKVTDKIYDSSSQGNHGYLYNGATSTAKVIGKIGQALNFDGTDDYIKVTDPGTGSVLDFASGSSITITVWAKKGVTSSGYRPLLTKEVTSTSPGGGGDRNYELYRNPSDKLGFALIYGGGSIDLFESTSAFFPDLDWHHYTSTYTFGTGSTAKLYVDGVNVAATWTVGTGNSAPAQGNGDLVIGTSYNASPEYWSHLSDDVRIYNRALSASEVKQLYNMGK